VRFVAAAAELEPDLARWTAAGLWRGLPPSRRRRMRDDLLRAAARLLPLASAWVKAHDLVRLARRTDSRPGISTAAGLVALAIALYSPERRDRELSVWQVYRIVLGKRPLEKPAAEVADSIPMLEIFPEEGCDDE
jgi:hypothetical protein